MHNAIAVNLFDKKNTRGVSMFTRAEQSTVSIQRAGVFNLFNQILYVLYCVNGAVKYAKISRLQLALPLITQKCSSLLR